MSVNEASKVADVVYDDELAKCIASGMDREEAELWAMDAASDVYDECLET